MDDPIVPASGSGNGTLTDARRDGARLRLICRAIASGSALNVSEAAELRGHAMKGDASIDKLG